MEVHSVAPDYTWNLKITSYYAGQDRRLRLSSQLKLQQEVGELHFEAAGLGYEEFYNAGMAFVITRLNSVIYRAPVLNETIRLCTWHRNTKGAQFFRCYQFLDSEGNTLIDSVSAFALVDIGNHKLLRPDVIEQFGINTQPDRENTCPDPCRWKLPDTLKEAGRRPVYWSNIDYNGHLNNTNYADIVCDSVPGGLKGKRITGFSIAYLHEALEGDILALKADTIQNKNGHEVWVTGSHERGQCFEARLCMIPE